MINLKFSIFCLLYLSSPPVLFGGLAENSKNTDVLKRYMVAITEKRGVGKKESCTVSNFCPNYEDEKLVYLRMLCPRKTTLGYDSNNVTLNNLHHGWTEQKRRTREAAIAETKQELALANQELLAKKGSSALDALPVKSLENHIAHLESLDDGYFGLNSNLEEYTGDNQDEMGIIRGWFWDTYYVLSTKMSKETYEAIAKELYEQEQAAHVALKDQAAQKQI